MNYYIGIDLGTSACKGILTDKSGAVIRESSVSYPVLTPRGGWTEQRPEEWLGAAEKILRELSGGIESDVRGLSFGGQMHGLVTLDEHDEVIRPAILWNDGRTEKQTAYLNEVIGKEKLSALTGNIAFAGFTAPKLLWMKENEPENFARIRKVCLPKDYLAYKLTGTFTADYSDASGMLLLDVAHKCWSEEMCRICGVNTAWLPALHESYDVIGRVKEEYGLPHCIVTAGAGDNAAAAIGTGTVRNGTCNISLGTSGTVFIASDTFSTDAHNTLHSFAHASGRWHLMGCILSAASCRKWWLEDVLGAGDYAADEADAASAPDSGLLFAPYLCGERSPHNDTAVRGAFIGLSAATTKAEMSRVVMEGVAFALRDCLEAAKANGVAPCRTTLCGGGAKSKVWRQILADVTGLPVDILATEQGPSLGAAMLAMVGAGEYENVEAAAKAAAVVCETVYPRPERTAYYEKKYAMFKKVYPALKSFEA